MADVVNRDLHACRLVAAIYPSRIERVLDWVMGQAWRLGESGLFGFVGDRADDLRAGLQRRRAGRDHRERVRTGRALR